jgi:hypothetical protein
MRVGTVTASTTRLTQYGFVNAYLVREDDELTLVDTTMKAGFSPSQSGWELPSSGSR